MNELINEKKILEIAMDIHENDTVDIVGKIVDIRVLQIPFPLWDIEIEVGTEVEMGLSPC